jgi:UDP-N-acetylmuramyl pentapeptide synthase
VIDESYNANPVSMVASLQYLGVLFQQGVYKRKIMLLGDMLELGENTQDYHADLATVVTEQNPHLLLLCGPKMRHLATQLGTQSACQVVSLEDAEAALNQLPVLLSDGDLVLVKSSHGTGLHKVVAELRRGSGV